MRLWTHITNCRCWRERRAAALVYSSAATGASLGALHCSSLRSWFCWPGNGCLELIAPEAEPTKPLGCRVPSNAFSMSSGTEPLVLCSRAVIAWAATPHLWWRWPGGPLAVPPQTPVSNPDAGARPSNVPRCQPLQSKSSFCPAPSRYQLLFRTRTHISDHWGLGVRRSCSRKEQSSPHRDASSAAFGAPPLQGSLLGMA